MKGRENIWFWLIAISIMVLAMCVLSLQLIELHQERDLEKFKEHRAQVAVVFPNEKKAEVIEEVKFPEALVPAPVDRRPRAVPSRKIRTPKMIREYGRVLYDLPDDGHGGFWGILRGLKPRDELIRLDEVMEMKYLAAKRAAQSEFGPSRQEIWRMFGGREGLDRAALPYVSPVLRRDIIVSSSDKNFGCDLVTAEGETFHYDSLDEIPKEAANGKTIWLHNINNTHWAVAIEEKEPEPEPDEENGENPKQLEVYFLVNP